MAFNTKINLIDAKVYQSTGQTLTLSGCTWISSVGRLAYCTDQSGTYTSRSVVDKDYVDKRVCCYTSGTTAASVTGATNLGGGYQIYTSVSGHKLQLKTLSGGTNITLSCNANVITICATDTGILWSGSTANGIGTYVSSTCIKSNPNLTFNGTILGVTGVVCASSCICSPIICGTSCVTSPITCGTSCVQTALLCSTGAVKGTILTGSTCVTSPIVCGGTCVISPYVMGSTCVCSPIVNGTTCITGGVACGTSCVVSPVIKGSTCVCSPIVCGTSCVRSSLISGGTVCSSGNILLTSGNSLQWSDGAYITSNNANGVEIDGQLILTGATGISPFSVVSTTVNTNLNADLLDGYHASAFTITTNYRVYPHSAVTTSVTLSTGSTYVILVNSPSAIITITLPATPRDGQVFKIKDVGGQAVTYNITIGGNGNLIDNASSALINTSYGALELFYELTLDKWYSMAFIN